MADNLVATPTVKTVPVALIEDFLVAMHTAIAAAMLNASSENVLIAGDNLCELFCNLLEFHPEPIVRAWMQNELRTLDKGQLAWYSK
jgi:hypothetical protein